MSFEIKEFSVNSTDNIHTLRGKIYIPEGRIKGLLQVVHGMTEHILRYDALMSAAAEHGFVAFGFDNLGHGRTAKNDSELGFISHSDGWKYLVKDVDAFANAVKNLYPDKKLTLMGHSMGSFIARLAAESFPENFDKLIICGTGGKNPLAGIGLLLTNAIKLFKGNRFISKTVDKMAFGSYNKRFENISQYDWLTKEPDFIEKYSLDKFCTFKFTVSAMQDLIKLCQMANRKEWFKKIRKDLPILLISGDSDPVGDYGKGVKQVYDRLTASGAKVQIKLYENCRHEILNDTCRNEVISDIIRFISSLTQNI